MRGKPSPVLAWANDAPVPRYVLLTYREIAARPFFRRPARRKPSHQSLGVCKSAGWAKGRHRTHCCPLQIVSSQIYALASNPIQSPTNNTKPSTLALQSKLLSARPLSPVI